MTDPPDLPPMRSEAPSVDDWRDALMGKHGFDSDPPGVRKAQRIAGWALFWLARQGYRLVNWLHRTPRGTWTAVGGGVAVWELGKRYLPALLDHGMRAMHLRP